MLGTLAHDLRYGARALRRVPAFTFVAITTLALGIGANSAMFGVVDTLLFRPPAGVRDAGRMVRVEVELPAPPGEPTALASIMSYPDYTHVRDRTRSFAGVAAFARTTASIGEGDDVRRERILLVSGSYFPVLGTPAALGRLVGPGDDRENAAVPVVVLSWDYWQRALSGDQTVIGRSVHIDGQEFIIIGVAPRHFVGTDLDSPALWVPLGTAGLLGFDAGLIRSPFAEWLSTVARLAPGVTREQATASVKAALLAAREEGADVVSPKGGSPGGAPGGTVRMMIGGPGGAARAGPPPPRRVNLAPLAGANSNALPFKEGRGRSMPVSLWFLAITGVVLLIACANVANLLLARATQRAHELAVRASLGASRGRLVTQLMTESILLAACGGVAGLAVGLASVGLLQRVIPLPPLPPLLDSRLLVFTLTLTAITTVVFGLAPAIRAARTDLTSTLNAAPRIGGARSTARNVLVVVQLAASLVLLVSAALFVRSLRNVKAVDTGFATDQLLLVSVDLRGARVTREQSDAFWQNALDRVRRMPGVRSAALGGVVPFEMAMMMPVEAPGAPMADGRPLPAQFDFAGANYFSTLGIPLRQGRTFTDAEQASGSASVAIINETLARRLFGGRSPLGRCVHIGSIGADAACAEVVGVAADAKYSDVTREAGAFFYHPLGQRPHDAPPMSVLHVRTTGDPAALTATIRRELQALDRSIPFVSVRPLTELIAPQLVPWRVGTLIFLVFGILGLVLASVGLYGVIAFIVAQRTHEMGVRIALGARSADVAWLVVMQGGRLVAIGLVLGAIGAAVASQLFASMMYGVSRLDPLAYLGTAFVLSIVALVAVLVPARRATRVDPIIALRTN